MQPREPALQSGTASGALSAEPWAAGVARWDLSKAYGCQCSRRPELQSLPGSQGRTQKTKFRCAGPSWQLHGNGLPHCLRAEPGPLCPTGCSSGSALCFPGETLQEEQPLLELFSCAHSAQPSPDRGRKAAVSICLPELVPTATRQYLPALLPRASRSSAGTPT